MTDPTKLDLVTILSHGKAKHFSALLELHGVHGEDQIEYMARAQSMAKAVTDLCRGYCKHVNQKDGQLFSAIATGMAMDGLLHTLVSKEESDQISRANVEQPQ